MNPESMPIGGSIRPRTRRTIVATALACVLSAPALQAQERSAAWYPQALSDIANGKKGDCFAEVIVPAQWREETEEVQIKAPSSRFDVTLADFKEEQREIVVRDASTAIEVVEAVTETETIDVELAPAQQHWVRYLGKTMVPASEDDIAAIEKAGFGESNVPMNSCVIEQYEAAPVERRVQNVLVREEREELKVTPAEYQTIQEPVVMRAGYQRIVEVPAVFSSEQKEIMTQPARVEWKKGRGMIQKIDNVTGEILCRVDVPAEYETWNVQSLKQDAMTTQLAQSPVEESFEVQRLVSDAQEVRDTLPALYEEIELKHKPFAGSYKWSVVDAGADLPDNATGRRICRTEIAASNTSYQREVVREPARFVSREVPAQVKSVDVEVLASAATATRVQIPGETRKITRRVKLSEPTRRWEPVLCETNMDRDVIRNLQSVLTEKGYEPGTVDGILGKATLNAVTEYQQANDLPTGGLTLETLSELGVEF